jgi:hypothetical protein
METGSIKIKIEEGKTPSIEVRLADNNLWLTKNEIARFFGVFVRKIEAELRAVFNAGLLFEPDCTYCNRYLDKGIEKQTLFYNLEVLIFISYRINSFEATVFRQFATTALCEKFTKSKLPQTTLVWIYRPLPDRYCPN